MPAIKLVVNGLDLSEYIDVQHEDGLDPSAPSYFAPQYAGSPALRDGRRHVADTADNREMVFPLILDAPSRSALHKLCADIDSAVQRNASVEFSSNRADPSSFFTLEGGHLDVKYEYFLTGVALTTRATLHLSTRPYAHTGTNRLIASVPMGSSAVVAFVASGILGDVNALVNLEVRVGSAVASSGRVVMFGVHPHPSNSAYRPATSSMAQTGATVRGASGAIGSQYTAIPVSPTGASGVAYQQFLDPPDAHIGRHRVIAVGRSGLGVGIPLWAEDRFGAILGPTANASQTDVNKWGLIDLGEVQVAARASGQDSVPTQYVAIHGGGAAGAAINASPAFHLNGLMFLPLDYSAGILRTPGGAGQAAYQDSFERLESDAMGLRGHPVADRGGAWTVLAGVDYGAAVFGVVMTRGIAPVATVIGGVNCLGPNASALAALGSGAGIADLSGTVDVKFAGASAIATAVTASAAVAFYPNAIFNASTVIGGVGAKLTFGPSQTLQIVGASSNGATAVLASAGIASTLASGLYLGQPHSLTVQVLHSRVDVWLATGPLAASPILSASHGLAAISGYPALAANLASNVASGFAYLDNLEVTPITGASDISPREYFRFESYPEGRVYQGNASAFTADRLANYRGGFPKAPPVGSGGAATGPAQVVVFQGEINNIIGNDGADVALTVLENFRFLV